MNKQLTLKWGTIKGWDNMDEIDLLILQEYFDSLENKSVSCMLDRPKEESRVLLCNLINSFGGELWNDWEGEAMTEEEACEYVLNFNA